MGLYNPYKDPWPIKISKKIPNYDSTAYKRFPKYNFVYDKLWVAKTQDIKCGTLDEINRNTVGLPIFIKPRYGNESASSKNCYKIKCYDDLLQYKDIPEMMWSEFIDDTDSKYFLVF